MGFYARTFTFADIPSEFYNVYLGTINDSGESITSTSSDTQILTQKLFRKAVPLFWGAESTPVLSFLLNMYSPDEISAQSFSEISTWLFGRMEYNELRICQADMTEIYFNCFLTQPQIIRAGNIIRGFTTVVQCDAPWGWNQPKTVTYSYDHNEYSITDNIAFHNVSANNFYTYPTSLIITGNIFGGNVTITNSSDGNRLFDLDLLPSEVITINNDLQIISSSQPTLNPHPLAGFNKNWLRLIQGINNLVVTGNISHLTIAYPCASKIGG